MIPRMLHIYEDGDVYLKDQIRLNQTINLDAFWVQSM